jgi:hypothetical protein
MAIPRSFHFIFGLKPQTTPFHLAHYLCLRSCIEVNRPAAVNFHYRNMPWGPLWDLVVSQITLRPLAESVPLDTYAYPEASTSVTYRYAHTSDFLRVAILEREGGVYADIDTLFIRPYPDRLYQHPFVMGHELVDPHVPSATLGGSLCNAVLLSEPGARFAQLWQQQMASSFDGSWSRHSTFLPYEISRAHPETIAVEPESSFFHLDWTREGIRRLFETSETLPDSVYSLHLWAHLWWESGRTDVSRFHADRLTPEYIAYANTTYARYARRFLPANLKLGSRAAWTTQRAIAQATDAASILKARAAARVRGLTGPAR